jgi:hypothetical protein
MPVPPVSGAKMTKHIPHPENPDHPVDKQALTADWYCLLLLPPLQRLLAQTLGDFA